MEYWKLGCRWGKKSDGKPLFFDLLLNAQIVISAEDLDFGKDNFVLLTDGFSPLGIAKTISNRIPLTELKDLEQQFRDKQIPFENGMYYYKAKIIVSNNPSLRYEAQQGIIRIHQSIVTRQILSTYNSKLMEEKLNQTVNLLKFKKQIILQGPPGTGKTRMAMQLAQAITGISKDELSKSEQVEIVQFHPSFSYEDLVEGLKASTKGDMVVYQPENGVFKNFCLRALVAAITPHENSNLEEASFDFIFDKYVETLQSKIDRVFTKTKNNSELILVSATKNSIIVKYRFRDRVNETAGMRPFTISKQKLKKVVEKEINPETVSNITAELKPIVGHIAGVLFGVYRDLYAFMKGNKIALDDVQLEDYDFQSAYDEYWDRKDEINFDNVKPFVFIIDEMNRANLSTVFGELISLMEDGKRIGADEAMSLKLPYSNDDFGIPKNLYIIGTMNTADRSVSQIDYAIRRRFAFVDVLPKNLSDEQDVVFDGALFNEVKKLFLNEEEQQSEFLSPEFKAKEVQLGHSYFINKGGDMSMRLEYEIKPILFEYIRDGILRETARTVIKDLKCSK
jgi:5-methylcytosine-specific restriction protein B